MTKIIVSDALQFGIQGVTKSLEHPKSEKLENQTNSKIEADRAYYANAYKTSSNCVSR